MKQLTLATVGFERYARTTRRAAFLAEMERVVPWPALCALIDPYYPKPGNGIEAEPRPAVGTKDRVRLAHIDVDVRVVLRWGHADALEFPHPDADFADAVVVSELRIAAASDID